MQYKKYRFIHDQRWRLLTEFEDPWKYLHSRYFRVDRAAAPHKEVAPIDRDQLWPTIPDLEAIVNDDLAQRSPFLERLADGAINQDAFQLQRVFLITDAGLGKTCATRRLSFLFNRPKSRWVAFRREISQLEFAHERAVPDLMEELAQEVVNTIDRSEIDQVRRRLKRARRSGQLVLILDGLDQPGKGLDGLRQLLKSPQLQKCRIFVAGRPHALALNKELFTSRDWRFVQLEEFDRGQQNRFLGRIKDGRWKTDVLPRGIEPLLTVPRVLEYIAELKEDELPSIRSMSDIYHRAIGHMLKEGLMNSAEARKLRCIDPDPNNFVSEPQVQAAFELLSIVAYSMTEERITEKRPDGTEVERPNFARVEATRVADFLREKVQPRILNEYDRLRFNKDIEALSALNEFLLKGLIDSELTGFKEILFRNRSLQEFLTAYYLAQIVDVNAVPDLWDWVYDPQKPATEDYYYVWRFLCEMPDPPRHKERWLHAIKPLFRRGDGTPEGTKRSNEMIVRCWSRLEEYFPSQHGQRVKPDDPRREWWTEFEEVVLRGPDRIAAEEYRDSFIQLPAGSFQMGTSTERLSAAMQKEAEGWETILERIRRATDQGQVLAQFVDSIPIYGRDAPHVRQEMANMIESMFRSGVESVLKPRYAGEAISKQPVHAFQLSRSPAKNRWFRLYIPGFGKNDSFPDYKKFSPNDDCPAIYLSWFDAWCFCAWSCWDGVCCRLPFEHEWEYAAKFRCNDALDNWWGDGMQADKCNAEMRIGHTTPANPKHANPETKKHDIDPLGIGLCDMLGNVFEWCADEYNRVYQRGEMQSFGNADSVRVLRGGSFFSNASLVRSAYRDGHDPSKVYRSVGIRVARANRENL